MLIVLRMRRDLADQLIELGASSEGHVCAGPNSM